MTLLMRNRESPMSPPARAGRPQMDLGAVHEEVAPSVQNSRNPKLWAISSSSPPPFASSFSVYRFGCWISHRRELAHGQESSTVCCARPAPWHRPGRSSPRCLCSTDQVRDEMHRARGRAAELHVHLQLLLRVEGWTNTSLICAPCGRLSSSTSPTRPFDHRVSRVVPPSAPAPGNRRRGRGGRT